MLNARTLFPPLFRPVDSGGGGSVKEKIAEIDSQITRIDSQITGISGDITQIDSVITRLSNNVGDLSQLDTTDKSSLVGAVNEVAGSGGGFTIPFSGTKTEVGTYIDGKKVYIQTFTVNNATASNTLLTDTNITKVLTGFGSLADPFSSNTHTIGQYGGTSIWSYVYLDNSHNIKLDLGSNLTGHHATVTVIYVSN